jgi:hypothetical protein
MTETIFFIIVILGSIIYGIYTFPFKVKIKNEQSNVKVNPKLQQIIEEATLEKAKIENEKRLDVKLAIEKEKERLLKDDFIYELIRKSIVNGERSLILNDNEYYEPSITIYTINLIPGLKAHFGFDGKFILVTY